MNDKKLLELIQCDPSRGFEALMDTYSGLVLSVVSATLVPVGTREDAQECASDVFVAFYRNCRSVDLTKGSIKGYLAVAAKHNAISMLRRLKSKADTVSFEDSERLFGVCDDVTKRERSRIIKQSIEELGEPDSTIIIRRYLLGETAKEIAKDLKMSHEAVLKRASRAKARLKETLGGVLCG